MVQLTINATLSSDAPQVFDYIETLRDKGQNLEDAMDDLEGSGFNVLVDVSGDGELALTVENGSN